MSNPLLLALRSAASIASERLEESFQIVGGGVLQGVFSAPTVDRKEYNTTGRKVERGATITFRRELVAKATLDGGKVQVVRASTGITYQLASPKVTSTHYTCEAAEVEHKALSSVLK